MLNNRELALLIWVAAGVTALLSRHRLRGHLWGLARILSSPVIAGPLFALAAYVGGLAFLGQWLGLWDGQLLPDTVMWFAVTGLVLFGRAAEAWKEPGFFRTRLRIAFSLAAVVEVVLNLFVFSLTVEIFLLPLLVFLGLLEAVAAQDERHSDVRRVVSWLNAGIGFTITGLIIRRIVVDWTGVDWAQVWQLVALPAWLMVGTLPLFYALSLCVTYGRAFRFIDRATGEKSARRRAKLAVLSRLHLRLHRVGAVNLDVARRLTEAETMEAARRAVGAAGLDEAGPRTSRHVTIRQETPGWQFVAFVNRLNGHLERIRASRTGTTSVPARTQVVAATETEASRAFGRCMRQSLRIVRRMTRAMRHRSLNRRLGAKNSVRPWERIADRLASAYQELLAEKDALRALSVPPRLTRARRLLLKLMDQPVRQFDAMARRATEQAQAIAAWEQTGLEAESPTIELSLVLTLDADVAERFHHELARLRAT